MAVQQEDILDRLRRIEEQLRETTGRAQIRPPQNTASGGDLVVGGTRALRVLQASGVGDQMLFGQDGAQRVGRIWRTDGTIALEVAAAGAGPQTVTVYDGAGHPVLGDDRVWGLARPWVPIPLASALTFTSAAWTTIHRGTWHAHHPVVAAEYSLSAPTTTTCQARLMLDTGGPLVQLGPTLIAVATDAVANFTADPAAHGLTYGQSGTLLLQVQRTAGTGTCTLWHKGLWARQSL
ncbi:hypothetical protein GCM10009639_54020 [Kitasatospora putterlickiae]|uniref:Uncharacterized protein n=1 Tax=Kitasatospora putterlickiae TaxID=221725 RepID=A0ABP4J6L1_9ACTN